MYSFLQKISGATVSVISTGVLRTPEGKAVAESPSLPGAGPGASGVEGIDHEGLGGAAGVGAGQARAAEQHGVPEARGALRGDGSRLHRPLQAPQNHVRQHLADGVAGGDGGGRRRVQD